MTKPWDFYHGNNMNRTAQNLEEDVVRNHYGVRAQPLIMIEPEHIIIDELHLLLRICDKLLSNLIKDTKTLDDKNVIHGEKTDFLHQLVVKIRECGVSFSVWTKKGTQGGTDIIACFMGQNWTVPVYKGEIQGPNLGCAIETRDEEGKQVFDEAGELVCTKPFPSMPVFFWNDPDGKKYKKAYFEMFPGVWAHGDHCCINSQTGGIVMLGRSDGVLNPNGVRFGSAEIYNVVESFKEIQDSVCVAQRKKDNSEERVVLFVKMATGSNFSGELVTRIKTCIRNELSVRYVPTVVLPIDDIPYTINSKKVEAAVRKAMMGEEVVQKGALANPQCLELYHNIKELQNY
ncbi:AACS [Mytilus edulis]|uniref:AACS n=1 Tax=Mytilus edulis TaxID=6550 RepID=A0A8S3PQE7_MYTED|nr:AACS [Mytilus edulis]